MRRPEFTVIAGPNGAGKSSLHPYYVNTPSFDGDKVTFVDSTEKYGTVVAIHISNGNIHNVSSAMPEWFKDQFLDVFSELQHISQINNQVIQNEDIIISRANILLQEAVQAVVERIQNPRVRCFSEEQIAVIAKYKNEDDTDDTQNQLLLLWSEVAKELEGKRGIMQKWIDDGHQELIDVWNGNVRESHVGLHRH